MQRMIHTPEWEWERKCNPDGLQVLTYCLSGRTYQVGESATFCFAKAAEEGWKPMWR